MIGQSSSTTGIIAHPPFHFTAALVLLLLVTALSGVMVRIPMGGTGDADDCGTQNRQLAQR
ncbi:hypothetical protein [Sodalis sp.]|uniref:hypothetical protein n=1 Tax=Sodalis sp. (in: enterobacteria) TaxID=1898979 RepID=UPI00387344FA